MQVPGRQPPPSGSRTSLKSLGHLVPRRFNFYRTWFRLSSGTKWDKARDRASWDGTIASSRAKARPTACARLATSSLLKMIETRLRMALSLITTRAEIAPLSKPLIRRFRKSPARVPSIHGAGWHGPEFWSLVLFVGGIKIGRWRDSLDQLLSKNETKLTIWLSRNYAHAGISVLFCGAWLPLGKERRQATDNLYPAERYAGLVVYAPSVRYQANNDRSFKSVSQGRSGLPAARASHV